MASHSRKDNDHSMFTSKTPHFFKVILEETIQDGILGLPKRFVRKYGNQLASQVKLEVPSGAIWEVELTKTDEKVWMEKGWREFAEHYSLEHGSFVVFRYEGNDHFHVLVFDRTASEIEYPCSITKEDDSGHCDEVSASRKNKEKPVLPCPLPPKKMRTASPYKTETNSMLKISSSRVSLGDPNSRKINLGNLKKNENSRSSTARQSDEMEVLSCSQNLTATEKAHVIQIANAFKSNGNPFFIVVMRRSFVSHKYRMCIPMVFAREFLTMQKGSLTLCNSAGKTWPAKYYTNPKCKTLRACLCGGWRSFVEDNHLNARDICVFRLIKQRPEILLKVLINPVVENASSACRPPVSRKSKEKSHLLRPLPWKKMGTESPNQPGTNLKLKVLSSVTSPHGSKSCRINLGYHKKVEKSPRNLDGRISFKTEGFSCVQLLAETEKAHAVQIASAFKSTGNPFFMVVMQPSFICKKFRMCIPRNFARKFLPKHNCDLTLLNSAGKTWPVKYYCNADNNNPQAQLYGGWQAFIEENHLCVRDVCVFEVIKQHPEISMRVVINPVVENASKVCRPQAHATIASRVKTRSLVNGAIPNCQQSPRLSSRKMEVPTDSYVEILDDSPLNEITMKKLTSSNFQPFKVMRTNPRGSLEAKGIRLEKEKKSMNFHNLTKEFDGELRCSAKDDDGRRCRKPDLMGKVKMEPFTPTEKQNAADNASRSSSKLVTSKSTEKSNLSCPLPHKKMRTDSPTQPGTNLKLEVLSSDISPDHDSKSSRINLGNLKKVDKSPQQLDAERSVKTGVISCLQKLTVTRRALAIQRASAFKSTENPVFMVVMQPSFVCKNYRMCIPSDFARNFLPTCHSDLTLLDSAGKTWPVKYRYEAENKIVRARLCGGWRAFVEDNHLKFGDTCVFELIKNPEILMKVVICLGSEKLRKVSRPLGPGTIASRVKTRSLASETERNCQQSSYPSSSRKREHPTDSYIEILDDSQLNLETKKKLTSSSFQPCKVMRTNPSGSIEAKGIKLEKERKSMISQYSTKELCGELKHSANDDSARMADVRRRLKPDLMVKMKMEPLNPTEKQKGCIGASGFRTSKPSFSVLMQPSYVFACSPLHIPEEFARRYLQKDGEMSLRVPEGKTWTVEYKRFATDGRIKSTFSTKSWRPFAKENELKVGDVCIFELIKENGNLLLEVVIQRNLVLIEID